MKIRLISRPIAPPWDSGSMNMAYGLGVGLSEYGHQIYMPVVQGFRVKAAKIVSEPVYTKRAFSLAQKVRLIRHLLTAPPVDIMHFFFSLTPLTATLLSLVAKIRRTPTLLTLTHIPKQGDKAVVFGQHVVTYSAFHAQLLQQFGYEQVIHIPPFVDEQAIHPALNGEAVGRMLGIPSEKPVILYAGELGRSATIETLLKAISLCLVKRDVQFVLACRIRSQYEKKQKQELIQKLQGVAWGKHVTLQEVVPNMPQLIARSQLCILPLRNTYGKVDIPLFLLEAMAMAKPIIITDIAPVNELLEEPIGLAVPVNDAEALAEAIEKMLVEGKSYGLRGRKLIERRYTRRQVTQQYHQLYSELHR